ncbi:ABC-type uncharacterized transport system involved in gliding motility auxiliary subunit [Roseimicrobium gellanilyticum]|uniref:ABC-type uncharacterized transport system involved in gliding motility auxiliary subunit n=1 Tax=Roseimicrobium gellanilyticum TaxID=748857 RepID=A0A366HUM0_9BACT|nr:Gldg family protein [Roseimicrobium gellanilyticum]RBP47797.1 ABC-type uncharacterized transport system involved in gliding motility auxiliary subunit [Roseimicrobium gellanilyticum]
MASPAPTTESAPSTSKPKPLRRLSIGVNVLVQLAICLVLFGLVNYLSYRHYWRFDLTPSKDYTLSEATTGYIKELKKDVELTVVFTRDSPIMTDVHTLVEEYRRAKKVRVKVDVVDPARDVERAEELKLKHGLPLKGNGVLVRANNRTRFITEEEIVIRGLNRSRENPSTDFRGEDAITSAIISLIEGKTRKFYFIAGKGAAKEGGNELAWLSLEDLGRQQNFELVPLNLAEVEEIPQDATGVVLIGARYDISAQEMQILQAYWQEKRAALLVLLEPSGTTPNLTKFLADNGVAPRNDRVLYAESTPAGPKKQFSVQTLFLPDSPISQPFTEVASTLSGQTQSLALKLDSADLRAQHIEVKALMQATDKYWGEMFYTETLPVAGEGDTQPPVYVAASVERGAVSDERLRVDSSRMVVVGNASMLDPMTRLGVHQDFIAASLNWMMNRERLIGITMKRKQIFRIQLTEEQRKQIFWVTAIMMPGAVLGLGLLIWSHRRA